MSAFLRTPRFFGIFWMPVAWRTLHLISNHTKKSLSSKCAKNVVWQRWGQNKMLIYALWNMPEIQDSWSGKVEFLGGDARSDSFSKGCRSILPCKNRGENHLPNRALWSSLFLCQGTFLGPSISVFNYCKKQLLFGVFIGTGILRGPHRVQPY